LPAVHQREKTAHWWAYPCRDSRGSVPGFTRYALSEWSARARQNRCAPAMRPLPSVAVRHRWAGTRPSCPALRQSARPAAGSCVVSGIAGRALCAFTLFVLFFKTVVGIHNALHQRVADHIGVGKAGNADAGHTVQYFQTMLKAGIDSAR